MKFHEYAALFPLLSGEEFDALVEDIKENGLLEPVWLYQGQIIDGRNRWKACEAAGVEPEFREYKGDNPLGFVVSMNLIRRHLSPSQRAALGVAILPFMEAEAKARQESTQFGGGGKISTTDAGKARDKAGDLVGVSGKYIDMAAAVKEKAPELFELLSSGEMPLGHAYEIAKASEQEAVRADIAKEVMARETTVAAARTIVAQKTGKTVPAQTPAERREVEGLSAWQWGLKELRKIIPTLDMDAANVVKKNIEDTLKKLDKRIAEMEE